MTDENRIVKLVKIYLTLDETARNRMAYDYPDINFEELIAGANSIEDLMANESFMQQIESIEITELNSSDESTWVKILKIAAWASFIIIALHHLMLVSTAAAFGYPIAIPLLTLLVFPIAILAAAMVLIEIAKNTAEMLEIMKKKGLP